MNKNRIFSHKGQDLVEFALALPIFMLIVMVIVDLGRVTYFYSAVHNAAREGARYGVVHPSDSVGIDITARNLLVGLDSSKITIDPPVLLDSEFGDGEDGQLTDGKDDSIQITVKFEFVPITPMVTTLLGSDSIELVGKSTMLLE